MFLCDLLLDSFGSFLAFFCYLGGRLLWCLRLSCRCWCRCRRRGSRSGRALEVTSAKRNSSTLEGRECAFLFFLWLLRLARWSLSRGTTWVSSAKEARHHTTRVAATWLRRIIRKWTLVSSETWAIFVGLKWPSALPFLEVGSWSLQEINVSEYPEISYSQSSKQWELWSKEQGENSDEN